MIVKMDYLRQGLRARMASGQSLAILAHRLAQKRCCIRAIKGMLERGKHSVASRGSIPRHDLMRNIVLSATEGDKTQAGNDAIYGARGPQLRDHHAAIEG